MKRTIVLLVSLISLCTGVQAQVDANINAQTIARAFALRTPEWYQCSLQCDMLVKGAYQRYHMQFAVRKSDLAITNMEVNDEVIFLDAPAFGIPMGDGGYMKNVYLQVEGKTRAGGNAGWGYISTNGLSSGESINVTIQPDDQRFEVALSPDVVSEDLELRIEGFPFGYGWGIDRNDSTLDIYMPPVGGPYHYVLRRRSDNTPVAEGWITPFQPVVQEQDAYFGINYLGNVTEVMFQNASGEEWVYVPEITANSPVSSPQGKGFMAKVLFADLSRDGLDVIVAGDFDVYVHRATPSGEMPLVPMLDMSYSVGKDGQEEQVFTRFVSSSLNVGKVVITVVPKEGSPTSTYMHVHRFNRVIVEF